MKERERLSPPPREVSDFLFEQRIFDFANKNLDPFTYKDMKSYMDKNIDAKEKVGAILLAFEYFNAISEIQVKYEPGDFLKTKRSFMSKLKTRLKHLGILLFFMVLIGVIVLCAEDLIAYFEPRIIELVEWINKVTA